MNERPSDNGANPEYAALRVSLSMCGPSRGTDPIDHLHSYITNLSVAVQNYEISADPGIRAQYVNIFRGAPEKLEAMHRMQQGYIERKAKGTDGARSMAQSVEMLAERLRTILRQAEAEIANA